MKRNIKKLTLILLLLAVGISGWSQDFSGVKVCINPGHGGHDSDDRYQPLTGFWESEGNLTKGLYLRDILEGWGADVVMTRTTNTTSDDLPLSQIAEIANTNNVDFFQSIHSNANNQRVNHPLMLFRGYTNNPVFPKAREMGSIMWQELINGHKWCVWEKDHENNIGDWSFYPQWGTQGLGVLRTLEMPGVLSEGSHHDYPMESWRLNNIAYRKHESWIFAKSYIRYFDTGEFSLGEVVGIARDKEEEPEYYYIPGSLDAKKPVDGVKFTLLPDEKVYYGDTLNNGFFMFDSLSPGDYQVVYEHEDYFTDTLNVTVEANTTAFADAYLQYDTSKTPKVESYWPTADVDSVNSMEPFTITFSEPMDSAGVANALSAEPAIEGAVQWENDYRKMTFAPAKPYKKATDYTVTLDSAAPQRWGVPLGEDFTLRFTSRHRNRYHLVRNYPRDGQQDVNPQMQVSLYFDAPLYQSSLRGNVRMTDADGNELEFANPKINELDGMGVYRFSPKNGLEENASYTLHISGEVSDEDGNILYEDREIAFATGEMPDPAGEVLFGFEDDLSWDDPDDHAETSGTDPARTYFIVYSKPVIEGTASGRLDYRFTGEDAQVVLGFPEDKEVVNGMDLFALWMYGDMSFNALQVELRNDAGEKQTLHMDTLYWSGWRMLSFEQEAVELEGSVFLDALVIKRTEKGTSSGSVYFDNIMTAMDLSSGIENAKSPVVQVYPNPADKYLTIHFKDGRQQTQVFELFDAQGKAVWSQKLPGAETISVRLPHLQPGLYFYRIAGAQNKAGRLLIR